MPEKPKPQAFADSRGGEMTPQQWVDYIIVRGLETRASDIHLEPHQKTFAVRYRVDGILRTMEEQPMAYYDMVLARIKILCQLDITERRLPQDGHYVMMLPDLSGREIDLRIATFPTVLGEALAIRILNREDLIFENFEKLGMTPHDADLFRDAVTRPHGMILVTGPAGSGKTTTLYTALAQIKSEEKNIVTLEDPVEYQLELVRQAQINQEIGFTFARGMRSILRQDPDVIMIGEIRDDETAEIAVRAALTGRLLFSTLHTNDAIGAVIRLLEFNIPRSFLASALRMVIAKRLIRTNCSYCIEEYSPSEKIIHDAGIMNISGVKFRRGKGCENCFSSGYRGREGIYELLLVDRDIELLILEGVSYPKLWEEARKKEMRTLREEAIRLALEGVTTLEEAVHITA